MTTDTPDRYLSFGDFRLDCRSGELRKNGQQIRLQPQPAKLLVLLANRPGEAVTRGEIQKALWGDDTFVDFEHGINLPIRQIREALGDRPEKPRYIETVPRLGYRFIAPVGVKAPGERRSHVFGRLRTVAVLLAGLTSVLALLFFALEEPSSDVRMPRFQVSMPRGIGIPMSSNFNMPAISRDGRRMAFVGCGQTDSGSLVSLSACSLYLRDQTDIDARLIPGSEGASCPFFSPEGRWIAFGANGKLKKIDLVHWLLSTGAHHLLFFTMVQWDFLPSPPTGVRFSSASKWVHRIGMSRNSH